MRIWISCLTLGIACACCSVGFSGDPEPPAPAPPMPSAPAIVGPAAPDATPPQTGSKSAPFYYHVGSKGKVTLVTTADKIAWSLDDAPVDTEVLPGQKMLWFPTNAPGLYHAVAACAVANELQIVHAWIQIGDPTLPDQNDATAKINRRLKAAFVGTDGPADAKAFGAAIDALYDRLNGGQIIMLGDFEDALKSGLAAVNWKVGKYPDVSALMGELTWVNVADRNVTAAEKSDLLVNLKTIVKACNDVK